MDLDLDLDLDVLRSADPGPIDDSLLVLQGQHLSQSVWDADRTHPEDCARIRVRRVEAGTRRFQRPSPAVFELIRRARLEGLCSVPFVSLDWGLITALVERWRPETHTFHLRPSEATVTLQDVEVLLGLPVDGRPVTGSTIFDPFVLCECLLGVVPQANDLKGGKVKFKWLRDRFTGQVEEGAEEEVVERQARGYILLLLGETIFADHTGGYVHLAYLQLLENFDVAGEYSWGSAALANLYHNLCHGATCGKEMTGPFILLQVWAWERLPYLAPGRLGKRAPKPGSPLIGRWDDAFGCPDLATHVVGAYRHHLDIQRADEVKWNPYSDKHLDSLPEYCTAGRAVWRASVPLIFFATVEFHQPERVLRQFGFYQGIPRQSRALELPHGKTLQSGKKDWATEYAPIIAIWNARLQHVVEAGCPDVPVYPFDDPYVTWYNRMSRRCISRVGAGIDGATRCFQALTRSGVPNTFQDIGLAGLQHLAVLEKFLRLSPPEHRVFQEPEVDGEEQQLGEKGQGFPEQPIPQQEAAGEGQDNAHVEHPAEQLVPAPCGIYSPASCASAFKASPPVLTPAAGLLVAEGSSPVVAGGGASAGTCKDQTTASVHTAEQPSTSTPVTCHLLSSPLEETLGAALDSSFTPQQATERILPVRASLESQSQTHAPPQIPISWPSDSILTFHWIMSLMDAFEWGSRSLPPSEFSSICPVTVLHGIILSASTILQKEPNCVHIDGLGDDSSVVVVGDVHGQLHDLIFLLRDAGFPADNRVFVFNGDYVDRGAWGLETFLLLLAWKVSMPKKVFLLRGNHESKYCTHVYGFEKEVLTKYGEQGNDVYKKCLRCFGTLPLASIIVGRVYTAHGGLFRSVVTTSSKKRKRTRNPEESSLVLGSLEELSRARRTVLDPPWKGPNLIPGDILWSDPSMNPGLSINEERGMGLLWGPDCTEGFLQKFNLKLIIRSHEGPDAREKRSGLGGMDDGYTIDHVVESGKLVTLFSAPDYPQFQATEERYKNKGAYVVLEPPHFDSPVFHTFEAITPRPKANPYYDYEDVIDSDEELDLASMVS